MSKQESKVLDYMDAGTAYWQYRHNPVENQKKQLYEQANQATNDTWIILLGIIGTIGFVIMLVLKTI
jgi:hypothetical protein